MRTKFAAFVAVVGFILGTASAIAHHSFAAEFDAGAPINLKGTVTKVEWMNPHTYFYIDVAESNGQTVNWGLEMGSPNGLMRAWWSTRAIRTSGANAPAGGWHAEPRTRPGRERCVERSVHHQHGRAGRRSGRHDGHGTPHCPGPWRARRRTR